METPVRTHASDRSRSAERHGPRSAQPGSSIRQLATPTGARKPRIWSAKAQGSLAWELESVKDELYYQHQCAEASSRRVRELERDRSQLTFDYQGRVKELDEEITESNKFLIETRNEIQEKDRQLQQKLDEEGLLNKEKDHLKSVLAQEKAAIARVKEEYAIKEMELARIVVEQEKEYNTLYAALNDEKEIATNLKRQLVEHQKELLIIKDNKRNPPLSREQHVIHGQPPKPFRITSDADNVDENRLQEAKYSDVILFRLNVSDFKDKVEDPMTFVEQFTAVQMYLESEVMELRKIFRYYCFLNAVGANNPFSLNGRQFEVLTKDCRVILEVPKLLEILHRVQPQIGVQDMRYTLQPSENEKKKQLDAVQLDFDNFLEVLVRIAFLLYSKEVLESQFTADPRQARTAQPQAPVNKRAARAGVAGRAESGQSGGLCGSQPDAAPSKQMALQSAAGKPREQKQSGAAARTDKGGKRMPPKLGDGKDSQQAKVSSVPPGGMDISSSFFPSTSPDDMQLPASLKRLLRDAIFPRAHRMVPDKFQESFSTEAVQAALHSFRHVTRGHFFNAVDGNQPEMSCPQWLVWCKSMTLIDEIYTVAEAALTFVTVSDRTFLQSLRMEATAASYADHGEFPASGMRKQAGIGLDGFEECISRLANVRFEAKAKRMELLEKKMVTKRGLAEVLLEFAIEHLEEEETC
ncbi:hypothetical protein CYMTET_12381 [Cymbomonas tetramitiformis]|uniref:Uncharacterized protein n=1 Tax=Cymbomonas tetramitiformis TaxID=36881 RepID=A0AAE0GKN3_9CHLO|nr:hypothetical protein CYMTET_12381 [Cymbomonas tetramitiformis]